MTTMNEWTPISLDKIYDNIYKTETDLNGELWNFWQLIKIDPEKWAEKEYGGKDGFWVVAICGKKVIWYNDIEEGFNISNYRNYGEIAEYYCDQDEISWTVTKLFNLIKFGGEIIGQAGPPMSGEK